MIRAAENPNVDIGRPAIGQSKSAWSRPVETESECALIQRTRNGSHTAFAELIRRNHGSVRAVLYRYFRDDDEIDELAQRAFISAFRSIDQFRGDARFGSWLVAIARRQAAMYLREESRRRKHEASAGELVLQRWSDDSSDGEEDTESKLATLAECLRLLPPHSHDAVQQFYFERQSIDSIAASQGRSAGATRMLLMRIRRTLAKCVKQRLPEMKVEP